MGHMTLLVQHVIELPVLEVLLILLHMELVVITYWGLAETHKQQGVLSTNWFHSSGPATNGD
jgi:hypothetical protein